ncbi:hypothetical protein FACS189464_1910 [Bacteroidia bacterium]|nr:hypothetical protein FACS189464_1910 [Bacteroidia bacterium]
MLSGCSPQKRLQRLVAKHPELLTMDTVHFRKTLIVPERTVTMTAPADRFFSVLKSGQPLVLTDSATGIRVSIKPQPPKSPTGGLPSQSPPVGDLGGFVVSVVVPPDTIKIDEKTPVQTIKVEARHDRWQDLKIVFILLIVLTALIFLIRLFRK